MSDTEPEVDAAEMPDPATPEGIVAANVRRLRKAAGMTQIELAERVTETGHSLGAMAIWTMEGGKRRINVDDLFAVARVFEVAPQELWDASFESTPHERVYAITLEGGVIEVVTADRTDTDDAGWFNFYLRGERVLFAAASRVLCVRVGGEAP